MRIQYRCNKSLPLLAWVAVIDKTNPGVVEVTHGEYVEHTRGGFFEGAWAGDFVAGRPDETEVVFGTGAVVLEDEIVFVSSVATTDYLFYKCDSHKIAVANSLALLLGDLNDRLDPQFAAYDEIYNSILRGIDDVERVIPTVRGSVSRLMSFNLRVKGFTVEEAQKPAPPTISSFAQYESYLSSSYATLAVNARDPHRRTPLRIYSTQSRGYDSTAVNAIAAPYGLDGVFTVTTGKGSSAFADDARAIETDDDGTEIARILGIENIWQLRRGEYKEDYSDEQYFYASIHEPQDANLKGVINHLKAPALLLTGTLGELWYPTRLWYASHPDHFKPDLRRGDLSLHGLTETRLRSGFIQVAIPYIGARRRSDIVGITESAEMAPWRLGTNYDRPIPRRIAEIAGVPRSAFGQVKIGSVVEFTPPQVPQGTTLKAAYFSFLVTHGLRRRWQLRLFPLVHRVNRALWFASESQYKWLYYTLRLASRISRAPVKPRPIWRDLRGRVHCFAVNACAEEYAEALRQSTTASA